MTILVTIVKQLELLRDLLELDVLVLVLPHLDNLGTGIYGGVVARIATGHAT